MLKLALFTLLIAPVALMAADAKKEAPAAEGKIVVSMSMEEAVQLLADRAKVKVDLGANHYTVSQRLDEKTKALLLEITEVQALVPREKRESIQTLTEKGAEPATKARHSFVPHRHRFLERMPASWGYHHAQHHCADHALEHGYHDSEVVPVRGPFGHLVVAYDCYGVSHGHHHHHHHHGRGE